MKSFKFLRRIKFTNQNRAKIKSISPRWVRAKLMVVIMRLFCFYGIMHICAPLVMPLMKVHCDILVLKRVSHLSDGRSSGVKVKLPWSHFPGGR